ncbi:MAG: OmpH family outer membrane protein [Planctomycetaceae bacterium]|nr:OmpH family outer membrane protein [Planctomycetaceae bacterium]
MRKFPLMLVILAALVTVGFLLGSLNAQQGAGTPLTRVAVCDIGVVFANYERAKKESTNLEETRQKVEKEKARRTQKIDDLRKELESFKDGPEQERAFRAYQKESVELQAWLQFEDNLATRSHATLTRSMYDQMNAAVAAVAKSRGIDLVLHREGAMPKTQTTLQILQVMRERKVLYNSDAIDITDPVVKYLNDSYTRGAQP